MWGGGGCPFKSTSWRRRDREMVSFPDDPKSREGRSAFIVVQVDRLTDPVHFLEKGHIHRRGAGHAGQREHRMVQDLIVLPTDALDELDGLTALRRCGNDDLFRFRIDGE